MAVVVSHTHIKNTLVFFSEFSFFGEERTSVGFILLLFLLLFPTSKWQKNSLIIDNISQMGLREGKKCGRALFVHPHLIRSLPHYMALTKLWFCESCLEQPFQQRHWKCFNILKQCRTSTKQDLLFIILVNFEN